jgi:hypothetical protein
MGDLSQVNPARFPVVTATVQGSDVPNRGPVDVSWTGACRPVESRSRGWFGGRSPGWLEEPSRGLVHARSRKMINQLWERAPHAPACATSILDLWTTIEPFHRCAIGLDPISRHS